MACSGSAATLDDDGDGFVGAEDCDDTNADVYPGATETCNNVDDNCDGLIDGGINDRRDERPGTFSESQIPKIT